MKSAKRLFAILLAVMMVMAMTVPALAVDETYTVKITAMDSLNTHVFEAYQIFSGTLSSENTLTDVQWGSGINSSKLADLYAALKEIEIGETGNTAKPFADMTQETAASVSDILSANNGNAALVAKFQELITASTDDGYTYLSGTSTTIEADNTTDGVYQTDNFAAGYYVVVDEADTNAADMMLKVVGNVDVNAKMAIPSVDKYAGDEAVTDNANYSVGDEIAYTLTGTVPNFEIGKAYSYKFTDTMDDALDLVYTPSTSNREQVEGGVTVAIGNGENAPDITKLFLITYANHVLTISADDLQNSGLTSGDTIYVKYNATINSNVLTGHVVENKVKITSTSGEETTVTPEITEQVYPITLKVTKVNAANKVLSGAKFRLYRGDDDSKEYATTNTKNKFTGWTKVEADAAELVSGDDGTISLIGIGAGTFYLEETEAPEGYNKLEKAITIEIQSTSETSTTGTVQLKTLQYSVNDGQLTSVLGDDLTSGTVAIDVLNNQGATLPSTGGIGTTIFYAVGGFLVIAAAVILITRKRMNEE